MRRWPGWRHTGPKRRDPMEQAIHFPSNGKRLFGILHRPAAGSARDTGIVFLNAGPQNRVGPQRIYVHAARRYAAAGFLCLRMDLSGVGEADGPFPPNELDCHQAADVPGALDVLASSGASRMVALGLCGGARVAVRAALVDPRVETVVCWSAPIMSGAPDVAEARADALSRAAARSHLRLWSRRLLQPRRWGRYVTSPDARAEAALKLRTVLGALAGRERRDRRHGFVEDIGALLATPRAVLFAYGERDVGPIAEFQDRFGAFVRDRRPERRYLLVAGGDHTFASKASADDVVASTLAWLDERHPGRGAREGERRAASTSR